MTESSQCLHFPSFDPAVYSGTNIVDAPWEILPYTVPCVDCKRFKGAFQLVMIGYQELFADVRYKIRDE